ncbi:hypothetical protein [Streptomyces anulatus]|uniref:hypothetical protein n=1 Tax=Streptomyces anulatus TaxID=1892 RepID=UPI00255C4DB1|nr:hypothetical protein [Streptomyces anulatus]WIY78531.1 hypothetical protein QPM16_24775 [Streptomyces anulatus]
MLARVPQQHRPQPVAGRDRAAGLGRAPSGGGPGSGRGGHGLRPQPGVALPGPPQLRRRRQGAGEHGVGGVRRQADDQGVMGRRHVRNSSSTEGKTAVSGR